MDLLLDIRHCLCTLLFIVTAVGACAQDPKPDYTNKSLEQWIEALKSRDNSALRLQARKALGPDGAYAKVAVVSLIDSFARDRLVDADIAATLADYGLSVVPSLLKALKRDEAVVRAGAAVALGRVRPKPVDAIDALSPAMKDADPNVRAAAIKCLGIVGREKAIPSLIMGLQDRDVQVRRNAADALSKLGRNSKPALQHLILALKDKDGQVLELAAEAIYWIGPDAKAAVPELIERFQKKNDPAARSAAAGALGGIGPDAKAAVPLLVHALGDKNECVRDAAVTALGEIGPNAKEAVSALMAVVKDQNSSERKHAVTALGRIGPEAKAAVPVLMEALADAGLDLWAAEALGRIGPAAKAAVPELARIARQQVVGNEPANPSQRQQAAKAVMKIDAEFGKKNDIEVACFDVRLGPIPSIKLEPRPALTDDKNKLIKKLIADLAGIDAPDFGLSAAVTGRSFAPVPGHERAEMMLLTGQPHKSSKAFRSLVEMGADALPFLLESLEDATPTKLKIEPMLNPLLFGNAIEGNPLNQRERQMMEWEPKRQIDDDDDDADLPYTLKVGDVCFVAIGQIVGRSYNAVRYQPTAMVIINSPVLKKELRDNVRVLWSGNDPVQKLFDSLLRDYATEGVFNGKTLDGWDEGSEWQASAALRMLYYFPKETAPLIARRLRSFDVKSAEESERMKREVKNGVDVPDFIDAVSWCADPAIKEALADIAKKTNDRAIRGALKRGQIHSK
jgi:HEAT repeat protein